MPVPAKSITDITQQHANTRASIIALTPAMLSPIRRQLNQLNDGAAIEYIHALTVDHWLAQTWNAQLPEAVLLRPSQVQVLAKQAAEAVARTVGNPALGAMGPKFLQAFNTRNHYRIDAVSQPRPGKGGEAFQLWHDRFTQAVSDVGGITPSQLPAALAEHPDMSALDTGPIYLAGTAEVLPAHKYLFQMLAAAGTRVEDVLLDEPSAAHAVYRWGDDEVSPEDECLAAASWAAAKLTANEKARVAIAVPDLAEAEPATRRALEQCLYAGGLYPAETGVQGFFEPWRIGTGSLAGYPIIAAAIDIIALATPNVELEHFSRTIRSAFIEEANDPAIRDMRHQLDIELRENHGRQVAYQTLRRVVDDQEALAPLKASLDGADAVQGSQLPSLWGETFRQQLLAAGWPNRPADDTVVQQAIVGFNDVIDGLGALDLVAGAITREEAIGWLKTLAEEKRFELTRDSQLPVTVIEYQELHGQHYDALWVLGATTDVLPRKTDPQCFLSATACASAGVPYSTPGDCLARGKQWVEKALRSANDVVFSAAGVSREGAPMSHSNILPQGLQEIAVEIASSHTATAAMAQPVTDDVRAVSAAEAKNLKGGTGIFKAIGMSPFTAFVTIRLGLQPFPEVTDGVEASLQGVWLHAALEAFWKEHKDSKTLKALTVAERDNAINAAVDHALRKGRRYGEQTMALEKRRLRSLVTEWLAFEEARPDEFTVVATEKAAELKIGGIPISVKIDRIDRIETEGSPVVVLDYKTGTTPAVNLDASNLKEPQLPIYAAYGERSDGLILATVRQGEMSCHTRSNWTNDIMGKRRNSKNDVASPEAWGNSIVAWRRRIDEMANQLMSGDLSHDFGLKASEMKYHPHVVRLAGQHPDD